MGQWVVSVAAIAILSVLCDVIMPEGKTRKYIKTVIGVVVTLVMLQPILSFVSGTLAGVDLDASDKKDMTIQQSYLDMVEDKQFESQLSYVLESLKGKDINCVRTSGSSHSKTITLQVDAVRSQQIELTIDNAFKTYFKEYQIIIKWKEA